MSLPERFLARPFAHRGLHGPGRCENGLAAIRAAACAGYGIEIDVQPSADGAAMVFHDERLDRLTAESGAVRKRSAAELATIALLGDAGTIPTLAEVLEAVAGRVPLLVELKDQSGAMEGTDGVLERAVSTALEGYGGPVAAMSFNPDMVAAMAKIAPNVPRGLTTAAFGPGWALPVPLKERLRDIADYERCGATFVSHEAADLDRPRLAALGAWGAAVLCWTIRNSEEARRAYRVADQITFEGFCPP